MTTEQRLESLRSENAALREALEKTQEDIEKQAHEPCTCLTDPEQSCPYCSIGIRIDNRISALLNPKGTE